MSRVGQVWEISLGEDDPLPYVVLVVGGSKARGWSLLTLMGAAEEAERRDVHEGWFEDDGVTWRLA